ncbi:MAG: SCP2 sterol-binding domain-containing protein [Bryobacteraceae bacterium]
MSPQQLDLTVTDKVVSLVETANGVPAIARMMRGWDRSFTLSVDGEEITIVTSGGRARVLTNPPRKAGVWFGLTERTLDMLIAKRLSPFTAKLSGRLRSAGNIADILRFASVFTACLQQSRSGHSLISTTTLRLGRSV